MNELTYDLNPVASPIPVCEARQNGQTIIISEAEAADYIAKGWTVPPRVVARLGNAPRWAPDFSAFADSARVAGYTLGEGVRPLYVS